MAALREARLIKESDTRVKIIGGEELKKKLVIVGLRTTDAAHAAIEKAGGTVTASEKGKKAKKTAKKVA
jgi:ribosomal protein L15